MVCRRRRCPSLLLCTWQTVVAALQSSTKSLNSSFYDAFSCLDIMGSSTTLEAVNLSLSSERDLEELIHLNLLKDIIVRILTSVLQCLVLSSCVVWGNSLWNVKLQSIHAVVGLMLQCALDFLLSCTT
jgi:hypothetical protein